MGNGIAFKRRELPGLDPRHYRIVQGLDSAAALVTEDGVVAAAAEERFTGEKATGAFPVRSIEFCLRRAGIDMADVDRVAYGFDYRPSELDDASAYTRRRFDEVYSPEVMRAQLAERWPDLDWETRFVPVPHHLAHAASAFHLSGFDEALVLVADGMGETESLTVAAGRGRDLEVLHTVPALHSLGSLYGAATLHLGFEFAMDEYKVMGLAPYGDRERHAGLLDELVRLGPDGTFSVPLLGENRDWREHETHAGSLRGLTRLFGPPREKGEPLEQRHMDMAAAVQTALERALTHVLRHFSERTGLRRLCLAGGVALNCTANGVISRSRLFDDVFVQPAAGDDGSALGAALHVHQSQPGTAAPGRMTMPYWGPEFPAADIDALLAGAPGCVTRPYEERAHLVTDVAKLLADGDVVSWFQGRMEFGPRALGNRSILADPRDPQMRDRLNGLIKQREDFRPFAPVVREEDAHEYFEITRSESARHAHMLFTVRTREEFRSALPAITHVDGTARIQVVRRSDNERLWELIGAFGTLTGVPVLLNTSFNLRGQPVIADPALALSTYLRSRLDHLVLGDVLVTRTADPDEGR
ncbi:carbamoyltransferase [Streptomyces sp. NPDC050504]|uniref:carbamoyltransferase n=1 Tax=Streptomyces sp. NPDC050504 TaxID=3365618 RepID=UPI0037A10A62